MPPKIRKKSEGAALNQPDQVMTGLATTYAFLDKWKYYIVGGFSSVVVVLLAVSWWSSYQENKRVELAQSFFDAFKYFDAPVGENAVARDGLPAFKTEEEKFTKLADEMDAFLKENSSQDIAETAHLVKATAKMELRDFEAAYQELKAYIDADPESSLGPMVLENLGYACVNLGKIDEAIGYFEKMDESSADAFVSAMALVHLGDLYHPGAMTVSSDKDGEKARRYYEQALELLPKVEDEEGLIPDRSLELTRDMIRNRIALLELG